MNDTFLQVLEIARDVTKQVDKDKAKAQFIKRLNESDMYFTEKPIPANESDENAHKLCSSAEGAMKYCPVRWEAMQNWFSEARRVIYYLLPHSENCCDCCSFICWSFSSMRLCHCFFLHFTLKVLLATCSFHFTLLPGDKRFMILSFNC